MDKGEERGGNEIKGRRGMVLSLLLVTTAWQVSATTLFTHECLTHTHSTATLRARNGHEKGT